MGGDRSSVCLAHGSSLILHDARGMLPGWLLGAIGVFCCFFFQQKEGFKSSLRKLHLKLHIAAGVRGSFHITERLGNLCHYRKHPFCFRDFQPRQAGYPCFPQLNVVSDLKWLILVWSLRTMGKLE